MDNLLKGLFTSNTRIKLLTLFLLNPDEEYFIRELTRKLEEQINSVRRELDNLKKEWACPRSHQFYKCRR